MRHPSHSRPGCGSVYPILLLDPDVIGRFVEAVGTAVDVLAFPGGPSPARLAGTGVARVGFGGSLFHAEQEHWRTTLRELASRLP